MIEFDVVTVYHKDSYYDLAQELSVCLNKHEHMPFRFIGVDNRPVNRGFAHACNLGATEGDAPYIAFLNPDITVEGSIFEAVKTEFEQDPNLVITGERFDKPEWEITSWGCRDWVCGAAFFVRRTFWETVGGFDEQYVWSWEESDLIRQAQALQRGVKSIKLPIRHYVLQPSEFDPYEANYKNFHFRNGAIYYQGKWNPYVRK